LICCSFWWERRPKSLNPVSAEESGRGADRVGGRAGLGRRDGFSGAISRAEAELPFHKSLAHPVASPPEPASRCGRAGGLIFIQGAPPVLGRGICTVPLPGRGFWSPLPACWDPTLQSPALQSSPGPATTPREKQAPSRYASASKQLVKPQFC